MSAETLSDLEEFAGLNGYLHAREIRGVRRAAIMPLLFTHAIITYEQGSAFVEDRWCYRSLDDAAAALEAWAESGYQCEPQGWHRHPMSGRRRAHGDPATETIAP